MSFDPQAMPKVLQIYLEISQYPILAARIRERMREEIFTRGVIDPQLFEQEVHDKAISSQEREGLVNPFEQEPLEIWNQRTSQIRDHLTDFYFAYNMPHDRFQEIVADVLSKRTPAREVILSFNPELAPWDMLFAQARAYEAAPLERRAQVQHHLREIIVVLIKSMISDQLGFVRVAREFFTIEDLQQIRDNRIGRGKIGGKAAGMLLAHKILQRLGETRGIDVERYITIPESYFIGSDVFYDFHANNDLFEHMNMKYKRPEQMVDDYPVAYNAYLNSHLPDLVMWKLSELLWRVKDAPLIVRSSSLLEDNFDTAFAGKYDSFFLPNQASHEENLTALAQAIIRVYASVIRPDALIYRERMGFIDYDERMAILIQKVEGRRYGRYFFPALAGVGFSHNPHRWSSRIRREDGLLRMVVGLGTRAVDRVGNDYPRMVALSHPRLRPESSPQSVRRYSQHHIDVLDLEENEFKSLPITDVLREDYPALGAFTSIYRDSYIQPMTRRPLTLDPQQIVITFDRLLHNEVFPTLMHGMLNILEELYGRPVDIEFAGDVLSTYPTPQVRIALVQCRPLSWVERGATYTIPSDIPPEDVLFTANRQVPHGYVDNVHYIIYIDPRAYMHIPEPAMRLELGQVVGRLNKALEGKQFILMGPGRWGTSNIQLGVKVSYADIYNTRVLVEIAHDEAGGSAPEVSYGTHFFQDLVEANIYPLPLYPDLSDTVFQAEFFQNAPNLLPDLLPADKQCAPYVKVIDVPAISGGRTMTLIMNSEQEQAIGYLTDKSKQTIE